MEIIYTNMMSNVKSNKFLKKALTNPNITKPKKYWEKGLSE